MSDVITAAFYLPQFHPLRVNDTNWGPGFSEWTNVVRARPRFSGHAQPRLPGLLGFYDLRCHEVMIEQAQLAREGGVDAFCFYHYRFGSRRIMERPVSRLLKERQPEIDFFLCWANEPWTMAWDGRSGEVLIDQIYDDSTLNGLVDDLVEAMADERYLRVGGRPVFLIYQADSLPDIPFWSKRIRQGVFEILGEEVLLGTVYSPGLKQAMLKSFDFLVQFPPHRIPRSAPRSLLSDSEVNPFEPSLEDKFESYEDVVRAAIEGIGIFEPMMLGVTPNWDNTPRRSKNAHVLIGSEPEAFRGWVSQAARLTRDRFASGDIPAPLLFVNAWNEWAEGAILEPSWDMGSAYLDALWRGLSEAKDLAKLPVTDQSAAA